MAEIDIFYINLDKAVARRNALEESFFSSNFSAGWRLNRFDAIKGASDQVAQRAHTVIPNLAANWLSHVECAKTALARGLKSHILIAEDDTLFSSVTNYWVSGILDYWQAQNLSDWDIVYLDAVLSNAIDYPWFFKLRHACWREERIELIPLTGFDRGYAGAGSYIINNASLEKFIALTDLDHLQCAFDLYLRALVFDEKLKGFMTFPFLTTISTHGDISTVFDHHGVSARPDLTEQGLGNAFRRMIWMGAGKPSDKLADPQGIVTEDVKAFQEIFSPLLTYQLAWHY